MITSRTWTARPHSLLKLEQNNDGKYALYVQGRATGFHDLDTMLTALNLMTASEESLRLLQAMRNAPFYQQDQISEEAFELWTLLVSHLPTCEGEPTND